LGGGVTGGEYRIQWGRSSTQRREACYVSYREGEDTTGREKYNDRGCGKGISVVYR